MSRMKRMRLTEGPAEIATLTRKVWGTLFETYGWDWFNAIEARGVIMNAHNMNTAEALRIRDNLVNRGFAEYTLQEVANTSWPELDYIVKHPEIQEAIKSTFTPKEPTEP